MGFIQERSEKSVRKAHDHEEKSYSAAAAVAHCTSTRTAEQGVSDKVPPSSIPSQRTGICIRTFMRNKTKHRVDVYIVSVV